MLKIDDEQWKRINQTVINAWRNTERLGITLLYVTPVFGLTLFAATYWGIPETPVPSYIVLVIFLVVMLYLLNGLRKLGEKDVLWIRAILN